MAEEEDEKPKAAVSLLRAVGWSILIVAVLIALIMADLGEILYSQPSQLIFAGIVLLVLVLTYGFLWALAGKRQEREAKPLSQTDAILSWGIIAMLALIIVAIVSEMKALSSQPWPAMDTAMVLFALVVVCGVLWLWRMIRQGRDFQPISGTERILGWSVLVMLVLTVVTIVDEMAELSPQPLAAILSSFFLFFLVVAYAVVRLRRVGRRPRGERAAGGSVGLTILRWLGITFFVLGIFLMFAVPPLGVVMLPGGILLTAVFAGLGTRLKRERAGMVLAYVRQAIALNLPLPSMLSAVARNERGKMRARLIDVADELGSGRDIATSLRRAMPELPRRQVALIAVAERTGRLGATLDRLDQQSKRTTPGKLVDRGLILAYPLLMLAVVGLLVMGMMFFIVPKFEKIFDDFGTTLPSVTIWFMETSRWLGGTFYKNQVAPGVVWVLGAILLLTVLRWLFRRGAASGVMGFLFWVLPGFHQTERDRGMGDICHVLEEATIAGVAPVAALEAAEDLPINVVLRQRVRAWGGAIANGATVTDGARAAHMGQLLVGALAAGESAGDVAAGFALAGRFYDYRLTRNVALIQSTGVPVVVGALGLVVGTVVVSLFLPLVALIASLATTPGVSP